jgi:hypothetical protein
MSRPLMRIPANRITQLENALDADDLDLIDGIAEATSYTFEDSVHAAVIEKGLADFPAAGDRGKLDAYIAPRLHYALRLPRQAAADPGIWSWLASTVYLQFLRHRFPKSEEGSWWRYTSKDLLRNGVSRLWWGAEMIRSGPDYSLVPIALRQVRSFQFISELKYSWHRECARAFTRVLADRNDNGERLSPIFNAYLKTHSLERRDGENSARGHDPVWVSDSPSTNCAELPTDELIGPQAGFSDDNLEKFLYSWLSEIANETLPQVDDAQ